MLGQGSERLLAILDQSLASWFLALPPHLAFTIGSNRLPPPHVLTLHLQFYCALILLHRPFIPGSTSDRSDEACFPSHAICTTSANAIANIVQIFVKTFTLRQCPPFLTYPIFSAAIVCVYNAGFDIALAEPAKKNLRICMDALLVRFPLFVPILQTTDITELSRKWPKFGVELRVNGSCWTD